jgi:predicted DsbA family dithiol-disulfide isomerase
MSFGYGEVICPDCYNGEEQFIFLDKSYWLNRFLAHLLEPKTKQQEKHLNDQPLLEEAFNQSEVEIAG